MKYLNKHIARSGKPELACVLIKDNKVVATDALRLVEADNPFTLQEGCVEIPRNVVTIDDIYQNEDETATVVSKGAEYRVALRSSDRFPDYKAVVPEYANEGSGYVKVTVRPDYLRELADFIEKNAENDTLKQGVDLYVNGDGKSPIAIETDNIFGLIMPMKK